jgi:sortase A
MVDTQDSGHLPRWAHPPSRRTVVGAGLLMVVAAVLLGAWLGWQTVGTNVVAHRSQDREVASTVQRWERADAVTTTTIRRAPLPPPATGREAAVVRIPRFGSSYAVPIHPGVTDRVLARGFGHFKVSAPPGGWGNYAIAAHRVTHGEPLRQVMELRPGDQVLVSTRHWTYAYRLDTDPRRLTVTTDGVWVVDVHPVNPDPHGVSPTSHMRLITLVTCAELFHTDDRTVVFGHLVRRTPRT